jgi:hypothetical protein
MTTGMFVVVLLGVLLAVALGWTFIRRRQGSRSTVPQLGTPFQSTPDNWTEGETTRLLSGTELDRLYTPKPEYLARVEQTLYLLLRAAVPQHFVCPRARLGDLIQVKIGPQGMDRLRLFRKASGVPVSFAICDKNWKLVAAVDLRDPDMASDERQQRLDTIKERCLKAARLRYVVVDAAALPRYPLLRKMVLGNGQVEEPPEDFPA